MSDVHAMHLLEPRGLIRQLERLKNSRAILGDSFWRVANMSANVQRIVRRDANSAGAQRERRANASGCFFSNDSKRWYLPKN